MLHLSVKGVRFAAAPEFVHLLHCGIRASHMRRQNIAQIYIMTVNLSQL